MKKVLIVLGILVLVGLWYAFRPERLFTSVQVNESFPTTTPAAGQGTMSQPVLLVKGNFHNGAHDTKGVASIYELPGGKRVLRFSEFETSNGPDVNVYLVAAPDATDSDTVTNAGFVSLGSIKGTKGDQNYDLPADLDLGKYRAVTIWCKRFSVNFGTAPLMSEGNMSASMSDQPVVLKEGQFHSVAHDTKGMATVYRLSNGTRVLRFTNFETSNGPDVNVYLVAASDASDSDTVTKAGFVSLGSIKGTKGDQNYELSSDLDLSKYNAVTVWCKRFSVNFGTAPLMEKEEKMARAR
jgi:hypothetical protein